MVWWVVLVLALCGRRVCGLHEPSRAILSSSPLATFERFGFQVNGTMQVRWVSEYTITADQVGFFLCTREQYSNLLMIRANYSELFCRSGREEFSHEKNITYKAWDPLTHVCELTMTHFFDPVLQNYTVKEFDRYSLILFNCLPCPFSPCQYSRMFELGYTLLNRDYPELSVTDIPFLYFYRFNLALWAIFFLWFLQVFISSFCDPTRSAERESEGGRGEEETRLRESGEENEREREDGGNRDDEIREMFLSRTQNFRYLYGVLLLTALVKVSVVVCEIIYWDQFRQDGLRDTWSSLVEKCSYAGSEVLLFCSLILLSHGWLIVYDFDSSELQTLSSSLVAVLSTLLFFSMYDTITSFIVLYIFLLPNIFTYLGQNLEGLEFRLMWMRAVEGQVQRRDRATWHWILRCLEYKMEFFLQLKWTIIAYFVLVLGGSFTPLFFPWYCDALPTITRQILIVFFLGRLVYLLRPSVAKSGLFVSLSFGESGSESHSAWVEAARRVLGQVESGEHQTRLREMSEFGKVAGETVAFQYPKSKAGAGAGTEPSEGERIRNVVLGLPVSAVVLSETSDESTDSAEDEQLHGGIFTLY